MFSETSLPFIPVCCETDVLVDTEQKRFCRTTFRVQIEVF